MATIFDKFVGVYPLSKTLRFELRPMGKTLDNIKERGILSRDRERSEDSMYRLRKEKRKNYLRLLMEPILGNKAAMFEYVMRYYRCFMSDADAGQYPWFFIGEK